MGKQLRAEDLPSHVRGLAELLARQTRIDAGEGRKRVELLLENGRLTEIITHDRIGARELEDVEVELAIPTESHTLH